MYDACVGCVAAPRRAYRPPSNVSDLVHLVCNGISYRLENPPPGCGLQPHQPQTTVPRGFLRYENARILARLKIRNVRKRLGITLNGQLTDVARARVEEKGQLRERYPMRLLSNEEFNRPSEQIHQSFLHATILLRHRLLRSKFHASFDEGASRDLYLICIPGQLAWTALWLVAVPTVDALRRSHDEVSLFAGFRWG